MPKHPRRSFLGASLALPLVDCAGWTRRPEQLAGVVALPERSLSYAPLLLAIKRGFGAEPPVYVAPLLRTGGRPVASAVVDGNAGAAAISLLDFLDAVDEGAPLVAFGALTRRFGGQLVVSTETDAAVGGWGALLDGRWRAARCGLRTGADGTERAMQLLLTLPRGPLDGGPQWLRYPTDEALVAALVDHRVDAYLGRSYAAAQSLLLGGAEVAANFSDGSVAPEATEALGTVLVARGDRLNAPDERQARLFRLVVQGCAAAGAELAAPDGVKAALHALPDRDPLDLATALRLDSPSAERSVYATRPTDPAPAIARAVDLLARTGRRLSVDPRKLATDRFP
ncbi:MAG: hypothetical protein HY332_17755 [Chloroflexi bacterium]|nr:hypothetical protein [Chloroflexota bacterium]